MAANLDAYLWKMPSPRRFIDRLYEGAAQGTNFIVLIPDLVNDSVLANQVAERLQQDPALQPYTLDLTERPGVEPAAEIGHALRVTADYSLKGLLEADGPKKALIIHGIAGKAGQLGRWASFARQWGEESLMHKSTGHTLTVIGYLDTMRLPDKGARFQYLTWSDLPSALEVSLCCRLYAETLHLAANEHRWQEAIIASLSGSDIYLAGYLWDYTRQGGPEIRAALCDYARSVNWRADDARHVARNFPQYLRQEKYQDELKRWWARGWCWSTREYGPELHSALLALADDDEIDRRIWRAQAALVLPEIDRLRFRVIKRIREKYPNHWKTIEIVELGMLETYLHEEAYNPDRVMLNQVYLARKMRNELAHYSPVRFEDYNQLVQWNAGS